MRLFLAELRRRNVFRAAALYAASAWALSQGAAQLLPVFGASERVVRWIVIAAILGFPFWLILAWFFELTPEGLKRESEHGPLDTPSSRIANRQLDRWIIAVLAVAVVMLLTDRFVVHRGDERSAADARRSIAVLPFDNMSPDRDNVYFVDGMRDLILTKLADIGELRVTSNTSTGHLASHPEDLKAVAQRLDVASILEGSVQKAGNSVLVNVQLIDAQSDRQLWAESYERTLDDIFGVEGDVAQKVADALKARLTAAEASAVARQPTRNKEAYDAYLKAIYYLNDSNRTQDPADLERAATLAEHAVRLDGDFSEAYSLLALIYEKQGNRDEKAEAASRRALALDGGNAEAHMDLAFALQRRGDLETAVVEAREAVRLRPTSAQAQAGLGVVYMYSGRFDEALAAMQRAVDLDPRFNFWRVSLAYAYMSLRRYADARDTLRIAVSSDPADLSAVSLLAKAFQFESGDLDASRKVLEEVPTSGATSGALSDAWYWQRLYERDYAAALDVISKMPTSWFTDDHYPRGLYEGNVYEAQGDSARAKDAYGRAVSELENWIRDTPDDPDLHALLGLALARSDNPDRALAEAERAIALRPVEKDALDGPSRLVKLAMVDASLGNTNAAVGLLSRVLAMPAGLVISPALLALDPAWDRIRADPRFKALTQAPTKAMPGS
jgi:TolB-like protein/Tfp pilus assembly protein PilF